MKKRKNSWQFEKITQSQSDVDVLLDHLDDYKKSPMGAFKKDTKEQVYHQAFMTGLAWGIEKIKRMVDNMSR